MKAFIDANIYLKFYGLREEWKLLNRIHSLISKGKVELLFPDITFDEVVRRVYGESFLTKDSKKIEGCITIAPDTKSAKGLGIDEKEIENIREEVEKYKNDKLHKFKEKRLKHAEQFVKKIEKLRSIALSPKETEELINAAHRRQLLGNPPSKRTDPIGDNLVWEMILSLYKNYDVFVVSDDPDWRRDNFSSELHPILAKEWKATSERNITLLLSLGELISQIDPEHPVSSEVIEKEKEIPSVQVPFPPVYSQVGTVTVVEPLVPFSGSASFGSMPSTSPSYKNPCQSCGNPIDYPNIYNLCSNCLRGRMGSF